MHVAELHDVMRPFQKREKRDCNCWEAVSSQLQVEWSKNSRNNARWSKPFITKLSMGCEKAVCIYDCGWLLQLKVEESTADWPKSRLRLRSKVSLSFFVVLLFNDGGYDVQSITGDYQRHNCELFLILSAVEAVLHHQHISMSTLPSNPNNQAFWCFFLLLNELFLCSIMYFKTAWNSNNLKRSHLYHSVVAVMCDLNIVFVRAHNLNSSKTNVFYTVNDALWRMFVNWDSNACEWLDSLGGENGAPGHHFIKRSSFTMDWCF